MIDGLKGLPTAKGTALFVCGKCNSDSIPEQAFGANEHKRLVHLLVCPKCQWILGEWTSINEKEAELQGFAAKVEALNRPSH